MQGEVYWLTCFMFDHNAHTLTAMSHREEHSADMDVTCTSLFRQVSDNSSNVNDYDFQNCLKRLDLMHFMNDSDCIS